MEAITFTIKLPEGALYYPTSAFSADLPTENIPSWFNEQIRLFAELSLPRCPFESVISIGILTDLPSASPASYRLILRSRLTLNRLTLFRKPWLFGEQVSRLLCRYSCLHLLFWLLHRPLRARFDAARMLPYRSLLILKLRWYV